MFILGRIKLSTIAGVERFTTRTQGGMCYVDDRMFSNSYGVYAGGLYPGP